MKLGKLNLGKLKLGSNFTRELAPAAILSVLIGAFTARAYFRIENVKLRGIIAEQRQSISDLTADIEKCAAEKPDEKEAEPAKKEDCPIKEPVKTPDAKDCTDDRENRYADEMASCTEFFNVAMHMSAGDKITCKTAKLVHASIDQGMKHCDNAVDASQNSKEKGEAKFKKREHIALSRVSKISPPVCNISKKR